MDSCYTIGIDCGTDSVRALLVDARTGREVASEVCEYARWKKGLYCDPTKDQFRQHPQDHIDAITQSVQAVVGRVDDAMRTQICGISVDATASTPCMVDKRVTPLCETRGFEDDPNALFLLWKDHCAVKEAGEINAHAARYTGMDYLKYVGGAYSPEWFWAKLIYLLRQDARFASDQYSFLEHCDWVCALLTGCTDIALVKHSRCVAGHKALWHKEFGGLPPCAFFEAIEPTVAAIYGNLYTETFTGDTAAGNLSPQWAEILGLSAEVVVGVGAIDAHVGAIGAGIKPYEFVRVMGTSTCDIVTIPHSDAVLVTGICGQVDGSVVPQMIGLEAGQSAFGDVFAWLKRIFMWGSDPSADASVSFFERISDAAAKIAPDASAPLALGWLNGRRTPAANPRLTGGILGLTLGTDAPMIYRAFAESVAFGTRAIAECFERQGITPKNIIAIGGVAKNSPLIMQITADVLQREVKVVESEQCCALGAAIFAAVVSGVYDTTEQAMEAMASDIANVFTPRAEYATIYDELYQKYVDFGTMEEERVNAMSRD